MRIAPGTRALVAVLGVIFLGVFAWMYIQANQTEVAYVFIRDLGPYEFISSAEEFIKPVTIPANRDFDAITDPRQIVGKYIGPQRVAADTLVQAGYLVAELPSGQRDFPLALLPVDTYGYPVDIPTNIQGVFRSEDFIDIIALLDEDARPSPDDRGLVLFQKVRTLGIVDNKFMVALTYEQIAAYEGWKRIPGVQFTAAINQAANSDSPPLYEVPLFPNYSANPDIFPPRLTDPFKELENGGEAVADEGQTP